MLSNNDLGVKHFDVVVLRIVEWLCKYPILNTTSS